MSSKTLSETGEMALSDEDGWWFGYFPKFA